MATHGLSSKLLTHSIKFAYMGEGHYAERDALSIELM